MSAASAISAAGTASLTGLGGFGQLSSDEFIKVLIAELTHQDPFEPQDSGAILEQLSSLRNIESQMAMQNQLKELVTNNAQAMALLQDHVAALLFQNQIVTAGNLIGRHVEGVTDSGDTVTGQVAAVRMTGTRIILKLDTEAELGMDRITRILTSSDPDTQDASE